MRIGKMTDSILKRSVLKIANNNKAQNINTKGAAALPDCALSVDEEKGIVAGAVSTFTVNAGEGGYYAVHNAANNLYTCGIEPEMIILNVMLSADIEESGLKDIMRDCRRAADELDITIEGGHTEVTDALSRPLISAVAVGRKSLCKGGELSSGFSVDGSSSSELHVDGLSSSNNASNRSSSSDVSVDGSLNDLDNLESNGISRQTVNVADAKISSSRQVISDGVAIIDSSRQIVNGGDVIKDSFIQPINGGDAIIGAFMQPINAGDAIIMTKWAALEGTAILAAECENHLKYRFPMPLIMEAASFRNLISVRNEAAIAHELGAKAVHDISGGGIFAALWELAGQTSCGFEVDLKSIPLRQETIEITNFLGLNPYQMLSGGSLLIVTDNENELMERLSLKNIPSTLIGRIVKSNDKIIRNDDEVRYLDKPAADEILKLGKIKHDEET